MIKLDLNNRPEPYTYILSTKDHTHLGALRTSDEECRLNFNSADEISFIVSKYLDEFTETIDPLWDKIKDNMYVYVPEFDEYFEIEVSLDESNTTIKTISGIGAAEAELGQSLIYAMEINSDEDIARDDYISPTVFYDSTDATRSLLNRTLDKLPQWGIGHVDHSLLRIQRTFSVSKQDVYSFLTQTVAKEVGCIFTFDSVNRLINAYDMKTTCLNQECGYRGEFDSVCPKCGETALSYYGKDTAIFIDHENFAEGITHTTYKDQFKNTFRLEAGDDDMDAAVINLNPNGSSYLYYFSDEQKEEMPQTLVTRIEEYDAEVERLAPSYRQAVTALYEAIDKISYYTIEMMPSRDTNPTTASVEAAKLTSQALSPVGVPNLSAGTSSATVENAVKQYAKSLIKSGWFKIEVNSSDFEFNGEHQDGTYQGTWSGNFRITSWSNDEDTALSPMVSVTVWDKYHDYVAQKIERMLAEEDDDGTIFEVLTIEDEDRFKDALTYYSLTRLESFADSLQNCIDILIENGQGNEDSETYEELYLPYYNKLIWVNEEIDRRKRTIDEWQSKYDRAAEQKKQIQAQLNFEAFLGEDLYKVFCIYKREDVYTNANYVSNDLETEELLENAESFLEAAADELYKAGHYQHSISGKLINFLAMPEFKPFMEDFRLGNFIRVGIDGKVYRLRFISIGIQGHDISHINLEFSDVTKSKSGASDIQSILNKAQDMSTSYNATVAQVKDNKAQANIVKDFVNRGLDSTTVKIVNNADNQDIVMGRNGLLARTKNDFADYYEDTQLKLLNSGLYVTEDGWRSTELAIGRYISIDPVSGRESTKVGVLAKTLVGELILGNDLKIYSTDASSEMSFDNFGLVLNTKDNGTGQYKRILDIQKDGVSQLYIDNDGNIVLASDQFIQTVNKVDRVAADYGDFQNLYAQDGTIENFFSKFATIENLEATEANIKHLVATEAEIQELTAGNVTVTGKLKAAEAQIVDLEANKATIGALEAETARVNNLLANYAEISYLESDYIKAQNIEATYVKITDLEADKAAFNELYATNANVENLYAKKAEIDTLIADTATIRDLQANKVTAEQVDAKIGNFETLYTQQLDAKFATIQNLEANYATIANLEADYAKISYLDANYIKANQIEATYATISNLNAANASIGTLDAQYANINTLLSGSAGVGTLQTIHLSAQNVTIDDAVINSAMIASVDAGKITSGSINTNNVTITSANGGITLSGNTQQFKDAEGNVRVQIGQDAQGDFNFLIKGPNGAVLLDETGLKNASAIADGLIVDSHVAGNANISGSKLNISSVIDEINNDNTRTVSMSKIWVDDENQSLGAKFTQIKETMDNGVKSIVPYFGVSNSLTTVPNTFSESIITPSDNQILWRKEKITKNDNSVTWTEPCPLSPGDKPIYSVVINSTRGEIIPKTTNVTSTDLICTVYKNGVPHTPHSYCWKKLVNNNWIDVGNTTNTYTVQLSSFNDVADFKCAVEV